MNKHQEKVTLFTRLAGQAIPDKPTVPPPNVQGLRLSLIEEEFSELQVAFAKRDLVEIADAIGDLLYVTYGAAAACGLDIEPVFAEIHRSNMSKFIDGHHRSDGKWIKGPSYSPANLKPILDEQSK